MEPSYNTPFPLGYFQYPRFTEVLRVDLRNSTPLYDITIDLCIRIIVIERISFGLKEKSMTTTGPDDENLRNTTYISNKCQNTLQILFMKPGRPHAGLSNHFIEFSLSK